MKIRKEIHTRMTFAYRQAEYLLKRINGAAITGNILTCVWMDKFLQARKIYIHYMNEYQINQKLPLKHEYKNSGIARKRKRVKS
jgi:hypothetical protein